MDRYLAARPGVPRCRLQLLGTTAIHIAAKIQEVCPPDARALAALTLGACTAEHVNQMEVLMLEVEIDMKHGVVLLVAVCL